MIEIPKEIQTILKFIDNGMIWVYIFLFILLMYLLISLLTFSFIKPLKYLGIPTILTGILLTILRFLAPTLINYLNINIDIEIIVGILPLIFKPLLINGIICIALGILMMIIYIFLNNKKSKQTELNFEEKKSSI